MANRWGNNETVIDFTFLLSKITADGDCSHEIKRCLLLGRKVLTNLDRILKSRNISLPTKIHLVKAMVFLVDMCGCESWAIKKAEHWRIDAFELWCWRRLLRVPWTARRSNQSILKQITSEYSLEGLMLKLKLHYLGHLMGRSVLLKKSLMLGKIEDGRRRGQQRMRWLDGITDSMDTNLSQLWELVKTGRPVALQSWGHKELDTTERLNWTSYILPVVQNNVCVCMLVAQLCLILCNPLDCDPPGSSVCGILQTRILEWVAIPFSGGSYQPSDQTWVSCIAGRFLTDWDLETFINSLFLSLLLLLLTEAHGKVEDDLLDAGWN